MKLVAYFSHTGENYSVGVIDKGNTEIVAERIKELEDCDIFEIKPVYNYSNSYEECCKEAKGFLENNERPVLKEYLDNIDKYDTIYLGYPIWYGTMPMEVYTFLSHYDFNGKTVKPFSTNEGLGLGSSVSDIKNIIPQANVLDGLEIKGSMARTSDDKIKNWI